MYCTYQWRRQVERGRTLPNPGKFANNGEQPTPQPAVSLDSQKIKFFKIFLNFTANFWNILKYF